MRREEFESDLAGTLVPIPGGVAFLPAPLPPGFEPTWALGSALEGAMQALASVAGISVLLPNRELLIRPLLTREAVESNRLEGTQTRIEEVLLEQAAGPPPDPGRAARQLEVQRYLDATALGGEWVGDGRELTSFAFRALHERLISGTRGHDRRPGQFRAVQVLIGARGESPLEARFVPPPPEHVPLLVENLIEFMEAPPFSFPALITAAIAHYQFEAIHPFQDGNGRLGRLLIPLYLMRRGVIDAPLVNLSPFFERQRPDYLRLLKRVSTHGDWRLWTEFFLAAVRSQAQDAATRAATILELAQRYSDLALYQSRSRVARIAIDYLLAEVYVSASGLAGHAGCTYRAARMALDFLVQHDVLRQVPGTYPQLWVAHELLDLVYR